MANYVQELETKLQASRQRLKTSRELKALKGSAPTLFEIIDGEVSLILNKMAGESPLSYDDYLSAHGQVRGIMRIRNLIDSKEAEEVVASQEVEQITSNLKQIKDDQKQQ